MDSFRLAGIGHEQFEPLFQLSDAELDTIGARRVVASESFGFPCRVSLEDAAVGDELLLLAWEHQPARSPYRSSGPIFVRRGAERRVLDAGELTPYVTRRVMSFRAYDAGDMMVEALVSDGSRVEEEIRRLFRNQDVSYMHLHNAQRGCFLCRVDRA